MDIFWHDYSIFLQKCENAVGNLTVLFEMHLNQNVCLCVCVRMCLCVCEREIERVWMCVCMGGEGVPNYG